MLDPFGCSTTAVMDAKRKKDQPARVDGMKSYRPNFAMRPPIG